MRASIIKAVIQRIEGNNLSLQEASAEIGITPASLTRHLSGEYVRSDSLAKYRLWLAGEVSTEKQSVKKQIDAFPSEELERRNEETYGPERIVPELLKQDTQHRVVDLFCGCGGMSLGFDRLHEGNIFNTVLAMDIEEPMTRVFNDNHPLEHEAELNIARKIDLTEFLSESEVLAFYLDHLYRTGHDPSLGEELKELDQGGIGRLRGKIKSLDEEFIERLIEIRNSDEYQNTYSLLKGNVLGQTSVIGFHQALRLPVSGKGLPRIGTILWHDDGKAPSEYHTCPDNDLYVARQKLMLRQWLKEVERLEERASGSGSGQLSSSARRIENFIQFLKSSPMLKVREAWIEWKALRDTLRINFFDRDDVKFKVKEVYNRGRQVSVVLGGPPCQGFSRIGRGKLRSLREQSVHVHEDDASGDSRNQLMHQYVMFVGALAPSVFLFENVRHFKSSVKLGGKQFDAADILAEAIENVSSRGIAYSVSSQIINASRHLVPQARERFFMAGVRKDTNTTYVNLNPAKWCLALPKYESVPLEAALEGLPEPLTVKEDIGHGTGTVPLREKHRVVGDTPFAKYNEWVSKPEDTLVDGHIARPARVDDRGFFEMLGPGKRWMDYRCDDSPTMQGLQKLVNKIYKLCEHNTDFLKELDIDINSLEELRQAVDGSLTLRLLLEGITPLPGEEKHHLITDTYLRKKEGQHGDWLARMDPARPSKTVVSHMAKDTYAYVHPTRPRTISVREAARIQSFPDDYKFGSVGLVDGFRVTGNAVPPLLGAQLAERVAQLLQYNAGQFSADPTVTKHHPPAAENV